MLLSVCFCNNSFNMCRVATLMHGLGPRLRSWTKTSVLVFVLRHVVVVLVLIVYITDNNNSSNNKDDDEMDYSAHFPEKLKMGDKSKYNVPHFNTCATRIVIPRRFRLVYMMHIRAIMKPMKKTTRKTPSMMIISVTKTPS